MPVRPLLVVLLVAGVAAAAPAPRPRLDRLSEALAVKNLQGTWTMLRYENGGNPIGAAGLKVKISNDTWAFYREGAAAPSSSYNLAIDATRKPAWLDLTQVSSKTFMLQGIAKVEGDTLTLTFAVSARPGMRPVDFNGTAEGTYLLVLRRDKP